jgi:hypothetical protein
MMTAEAQQMENANDSPENIAILPPDKTLLNKLGAGNLDKIMSPEAIKKAETVITNASGDLYQECMTESAKLQLLTAHLESSDKNIGPKLKKIVSVAFGIKSKAAQSGYNLVSALAKSLHMRCEEMTMEQTTPAAIKIIAWHAQSIAQLLALKVKGEGGEIGKAIIAELERIKLSA